MGLLVAIESDVADLGNRDQGQESVDHAQTGPEYGYDGQFPAGHHLCGHTAYRGLDLFIFKREVPGDFIAHQEGYFLKQFPEILAACR